MSKEMFGTLYRGLNFAPPIDLGVTALESKRALVSVVLNTLEMMELGGRPLSARTEFEQRLTELTKGRTVPLVVFNCLEFAWVPNGNRYPKSIVSGDPQLSICGYFQDEIELIKLELEQLGKPMLQIVIPDSELFDDRPFSFAQTRDERVAIAQQAKLALTERLIGLDDPESPVVLWSEYCHEHGLPAPMEYTGRNYERIKNDPKLLKKARDQVQDSKKYFEKGGLFAQYVRNIGEQELLERVIWYCAMYAGEGQALLDSGAIALNFEDGRVPAWFQRGADGKLPILTPADPKQFYIWRKNF